MDRRRLLVVAAAIVAALGAALLFVYVRAADERAAERFRTVPVLRATQVIEAGESIDEALRTGKVAQDSVVEAARLPTALQDTTAIAGKFATTTIYPGEQIIPERFAETAEMGRKLLIPEPGDVAISVSVTDTARVAGFVNPGSEVAIFVNGSDTAGRSFNRLLLPRVKVLGVGSTAPVAQAPTDGSTAPEALPATLITLSVNQEEAQRVMFADSSGDLVFALLDEDSRIRPGSQVDFDTLFE